MDDLKGKMKEIQHYVEILKEQNKADENERNEQQAKNIDGLKMEQDAILKQNDLLW